MPGDFSNALHEFIQKQGFSIQNPILDNEFHTIDEGPKKGGYVGGPKAGGRYFTFTIWDWIDEKHTFKWGNISEQEYKDEVEKSNSQKLERQKKAAIEAQEIWQKASTKGYDHVPYLLRKRIDNLYGARVDETGAGLIIPVTDGKELVGLQRIYANGDKTFIKGQRVQGCFHLIGKIEDVKRIVVAEGFATAVSVHLATGLTAACAFYAGNLLHASRSLRRIFPNAEIIVAADNDENEVGQKAARDCQNQIKNCRIIIPKKVGKDFNDIFVEDGIDEVKKYFRIVSREYNFAKLSDTINDEEIEPEWLVEKLFARECISLIAAEPKAGKSTLTRFLTHCLVDREPFLGRVVNKSQKVMLVSVEEKKRFLARDFKAMQTKALDNILYHAGTTPAEALKDLEPWIEKERPDFVILDTLFKVVEIMDEKNYPEILKKLSRLQDLAVIYNCHILCVHHANKSDKIGFDKIMGSQAIRAAFDLNIILTVERGDDETVGKRYIESEGREGEQIAKSLLLFTESNRNFRLSFKASQAKAEAMWEQVKKQLRQSDEGPGTKSDWIKRIGGKKQYALQHLTRAIREGLLVECAVRVAGGKPMFRVSGDQVEEGDRF